MIDPSIKDEILNRADIVDIIGDVVDLKKRGANYLGLCPFHNEKTPSFTVSQDKGIYKCFGCGKAGNVFTFMQDYHGLTFKESLKELAIRLGIRFEEEDSYSKEALSEKELIYKALEHACNFFVQSLYADCGKSALEYYHKRGFSDDTIRKFALGYSPATWDSLINFLNSLNFSNDIIAAAGLAIAKDNKRYYDRFRGRAMFPIKNVIGKVIGFGARDLSGASDVPKYLNSPQTPVYDKSVAIYGISVAKNEIRNKKNIILAEGYADVVSLHQGGFGAAIASCGTSLTTGQLKELYRYADKLTISYDSDSAGVNASEKAIELALNQGFEVKIVRLPDGEDPDSIIRELGASVYQSYLDEAFTFLEFKYEIAKKNGIHESPKSSAEFIRNIVKLIVKIPDRLQHDFYISKLAMLMKMSELQIREIYTSDVRSNSFEDREPAYERHYEEPIFSAEPEVFDEDYPYEYDVDPIEPLVKEDIVLCKEEIVFFQALISNERALPYCKKKLNIDRDYFFTNSAKRVFDAVEALYDINPNLSHALNSVDDTVDRDMLDYLIDLSLQRETISENWNKFGVEEPDVDLKRLINDSIIAIELRKIENEISEITQTQKETKTIEIELLMRLSELNKKRLELKESLNFEK
jgi:DNA primase